jgi:serine phosphatase RsbU (regulator of sigma subunit)
VVEIMDKNDNEFGIDRLKAIIEKNRKLSSKELIQEIINETRKFSDFGNIKR